MAERTKVAADGWPDGSMTAIPPAFCGMTAVFSENAPPLNRNEVTAVNTIWTIQELKVFFMVLGFLINTEIRSGPKAPVHRDL